MAVAEGSFRYHGHRIAYDVHGTGERVIVLVHGLLMNRRMYDTLAPEIASRDNRVVTVDLLGHGRSDRLADRQIYSMTAFADQVLALLNHLELEAPVVGGTSLGANVGLEFAAHHPDRAGALFIEMPVLEDALLGAALSFTPILLGLRLASPAFKGIAALARQIPRSNYLVDIALDWVRQDPEPSRAVLEGILFGRTAPTKEERLALQQPALVIGHPNDPLHPFSDADMLVDEMANARLVDANSILEWRLTPDRLTNELAAFLDEVYAAEGEAESERPARAASG
jgi:pimeloyl-ACP methyl ester carboxylesterase